VPPDLATIADPTFVLIAWSAGLAFSVAFISFARIVGPGYTWLAGGVAFAVGLPPALADGAWWGRGGLLFVGLALVWARNRPFAGVLLLAGGIALLVEGSLLGGYIPAASAALALGGVTGEMALGHWYLVDPRTPRWALRSLAGSLRQPAYSGVMAATGLSYLAVLTTLGAVFMGRALAIGLGPFA